MAKRFLGLDLGRFWRGFGKGLGDQNCQKIEISSIFLDMLFEILILVEFCSIFDNFDGKNRETQQHVKSETQKRETKNTFFSMGGCWCFLRGLGRKQVALR